MDSEFFLSQNGFQAVWQLLGESAVFPLVELHNAEEISKLTAAAALDIVYHRQSKWQSTGTLLLWCVLGLLDTPTVHSI